MLRIVLLSLLVACGADIPVEHQAPDAAADCCALMPDEDAVRTCAVATVAPGVCGVAVCFVNEEPVRINFCAEE